MKLFRSIICAVAVLAGVFAAKAEFRWGPTAGVGLTNLEFKQDLFTVDKTIGPVAGVTGEMMFPGIGFGVDISALYSMEGAKLHLGEKKIWAVDGYGTERLMIHNLAIPINLRFKWTRMNGFEEKLAPYVFGGPTLAIRCGHSDLGACDFSGGYVGLQCGLGVEIFRHWQIQGQYMWGMTYATKMAKLVNDSARSMNWQVRVTYLF